MIRDAWLAPQAMRQLIETVSDAIVVTKANALDRPGPEIVYVNPAFCSISGYDPDEVIGRSPRILQGPGTDPRALGRIRAALDAGQPCREEVLNYTKAGTPYWLDIHIVPLLGDDGAVEYFAAIERDVTEQRTNAERLQRLAHEDVLTGVGNRAALADKLHSLWGDGPRPLHRPHFLLIDLDGFKAINDTLGHPAGDEILRQFAAHAVAHLRRDDFVARLGGDEFVLLLQGYLEKEALGLGERIIASLRTMPAAGAGRIGASIGITAVGWNEALATVYARADSALYAAKAAGKGVVRVCPLVA
jgi:diguanylate cyclase (GGDEF)-like protein/PAS domain S-box-containing protein